MAFRVLYPGGLRKALTFSYDDGREQDVRLVQALNRCGFKGAFHLNSGTLGRSGYVRAEQVPGLYRGHEVACHGVEHAWLSQISGDQRVREIWQDRRALEALVGYPVCGLSYAFGDCPHDFPPVLAALGIAYARTVEATGGFALTTDYLRWRPTCHHREAPGLADAFLRIPENRGLCLFYIWGHSYEFDEQDNWGILDELGGKLSGLSDVWYVTNIDFVRYMAAARSLVVGADGTMAYNPSAQDVWGTCAGKLLRIGPAETMAL
jgi:hypothetical protein